MFLKKMKIKKKRPNFWRLYMAVFKRIFLSG